MSRLKKKILKYVPKEDYKKGISDLRWKDDPFKISFNEDTLEVISFSGVERGEWELVKIPYGFYLKGHGGECMIVVLMTSGQDGTSKITVIQAAVDLSMNEETAHVNWGDEFLAVQDMVNKVYFN